MGFGQCGEVEGNRKGFNLTCHRSQVLLPVWSLLGWSNKNEQRFNLYYIFLSLDDDTRTENFFSMPMMIYAGYVLNHDHDDVIQDWALSRETIGFSAHGWNDNYDVFYCVMDFLGSNGPLSMESNQQALQVRYTVKRRFTSFHLYSICGEFKLNAIRRSHRTLHARTDPISRKVKQILKWTFHLSHAVFKYSCEWSLTCDDDSLTVLTGLSKILALWKLFLYFLRHTL